MSDMRGHGRRCVHVSASGGYEGCWMFVSLRVRGW